jgi:hypothetical protein
MSSKPNQNSRTDEDVPARSTPADPGVDSVYQYLVYGLSLPERAVRSTAAILGGTIRESASLLIPQAFRNSKTYRTFIEQMLDVVSNDVGGVKNASSETDSHTKVENVIPDPGGKSPVVENYVARKAVSSFIDLAGLATLHVSPLTVLAIVSDVAYGSKTYLHELAGELKKEGVIAEDSTITNTAELLDAIGVATADTADVFDTPPISVDGLRQTIEQTRSGLAQIDPTKVIPQSEITRLWTGMQEMAEQQDVSVFEVSSAMTMFALDQVGTVSKGALTTIRVTGELLDQHIFDHYWEGLKAISDQGIYAMVASSSQPYVEAVWHNFSTDRPTITEDIVSGRLPGRIWSGFCEWVKGEPEDGPDKASQNPTE